MQNYELLIKKNADVDVPDYAYCYDDDEVGNHIRYFVSVQDDDIDTFENWAMKNCFIVYCGDAWLSYNSLSTIAVCTTLNKAISLIKKDAVKQGITLSEDDLFNLKAIYQTQGNDINYQISEIQMNKIIY